MRRYLLLISALLILSGAAYSQTTGLPPFGSLDQVGLEVRNNQNLNVMLAIPIISSPGRNGLGLNFSAIYNSSIFTRVGSVWSLSASNTNWGWITTYSTGATNFVTTSGHVRCQPCRTGDGCLYTYTTVKDTYTYTDPLRTIHPFNVSWEEDINQCTN